MAVTDRFSTVHERITENRRVAWAVAVAVVLVLAVIPWTTTDYVTGLAFSGLVFAMLGVSWNLIAGYAGQISLGHAAFFGVGAYVTAWITTPAQAGFPAALAAVPIPVAIVAGGVAAALLAALVGPLMFRLHGHYFAIGTLALATIVQLVLGQFRSVSGGSSGFYVNSPESLAVFGLGAGVVMYYVGLLVAIVVVAGTYWVVRSRSGLGMRAIKGDEDAASSLGVNPLRYKMVAFVVSSLFAGLAGAVHGQYVLYLNPGATLSVTWTIDTLVVVILGGMGTMAGPLLGAGLFLVLDNLLASVIGSLSTTVEGVLIILFVVFLPSGLYGYLTDGATRTERTESTETVTEEAEGHG
jgi:branched-chain amino acid transport system permease protein